MLTGQPGEPSNVTFGLSPLSLFQYTSILIFRHRTGNELIALMRFDLVLIVAMRKKALSTYILYHFFIFDKIYFIFAIYCTFGQLARVTKFHLIIFFND